MKKQIWLTHEQRDLLVSILTHVQGIMDERRVGQTELAGMCKGYCSRRVTELLAIIGAVELVEAMRSSKSDLPREARTGIGPSLSQPQGAAPELSAQPEPYKAMKRE